jgi:hypothetical protein
MDLIVQMFQLFNHWYVIKFNECVYVGDGSLFYSLQIIVYVFVHHMRKWSQKKCEQ